MLAKLSGGANELARIEVCSTVDNASNDGARQTLTIAHHNVASAVAEVLYQRNAAKDITQLFKQRVGNGMHLGLPFGRHHAGNHIVVTRYNLGILLQIAHVARRCLKCSVNQLIGDATKCRYHHNHLLVDAFNNLFHVAQAFNCANRRASKLQYLHLTLSIICIN